MRVFIYEYACAQADPGPLPSSVRIEGRAMRDCLIEDFSRLGGVEVLTLDNQRPISEQTALQSLAAAADWSLIVAPEFDDILWQRCRWVEEAHGHLLGPSSEAVKVAGDKWETYLLLRRHGVPTPRTALASDEPDFEAPYVQKPRHGAGSQDIRLVDSRRQIQESPETLLQEYARGQAASVAFLIGPKETVALPAAYQVLSNDGCFRYQGGRLPLPAELAARATCLAQTATGLVPGLFGYVGVDVVLGDSADGNGDAVIEINPRLTTSYVGLRALAADNLAGVMLRIVGGEKGVSINWHAGCVSYGLQSPSAPLIVQRD